MLNVAHSAIHIECKNAQISMIFQLRFTDGVRHSFPMKTVVVLFAGLKLEIEHISS